MAALLGAEASGAGAPKLTVTARVQTPQAVGSHLLLRDKQDNPYYIAMHLAPGNPPRLTMTAYSPDGKAAFAQTVPASWMNIGLILHKVFWNNRNEIIALCLSGEFQNDGLFLMNLSTGRAVDLTHPGGNTSFLDRIDFEKHSLIAVIGERKGWDHRDDPKTVRIIDEDTGAVVQQHDFPTQVSGTFGVDRQGKLKLLLQGDGVRRWDVASNRIDELIGKQKPDYRVSGNTRDLRPSEIEDLVNGTVDTLPKYPSRKFFMGEPTARYSASFMDEGIVVVDMETKKSLGRAVPKSLFSDYEAVGVHAILQSGDRSIGVFSQPLHPSSYTSGVIAFYVDLSSGQLLRKMESEDYFFQELVQQPSGEILAIERKRKEDGHPGSFQVLDVVKNKVISESGNIELAQLAFRSLSGALVAVHLSDKDQVCVVNLLNPKQDVCLKDPFIQTAIRYGYSPFETAPGRLTLPLLKKMEKGTDYESWGFVEYKVD